jgi:2-polyprenyl-3-methyl-5-hydroxy-6-metoxy-1,4-benzoquinol methylase
MKVCDLSGGVGQLSQALAHLKDQWQITQEHWNDEKRRQFEEQHLRPLPEKMKFILAAAQRLSELMEKATQELND